VSPPTDDPPRFALAGFVADGAPVDWAREFSAHAGPQRDLLIQLKVISELAKA
jgi:hypothetical protein